VQRTGVAVSTILILVALAAFAGAIAIDRHERHAGHSRLRHNRKAAHLRLLSELERQR